MVLPELAQENYPANEWHLKGKKKILKEISNYTLLKQ